MVKLYIHKKKKCLYATYGIFVEDYESILMIWKTLNFEMIGFT